MDKNTVFFGSKGLTATSANFVANLAKEYVERILTELGNINFLNKDIEIIGSDKKNRVKSGVTSLADVADKLKAIADAHALIAWLREGIKAKDAMAYELKMLTYETWSGNKSAEGSGACIARMALRYSMGKLTLRCKQVSSILTIGTSTQILH